MRHGFTLAELLVTLTITGVIVYLSIPIFSGLAVDYKKLYSSSFNTVDKIVNELIFDLQSFPTGVLDNSFCPFYVAKINTIGTTDCNTSTVPGTPNFVSSNGARWYGFDTHFITSACPSGVDGACIKTYVDVDGAGRGKNVVGDDILEIIISTSGKITTTGTKELGYLQ